MSSAFATDIASIIKVAVTYEIKQEKTKSERLMTGPSPTNPSGYENGPVARTRFTIVADAAKGLKGVIEGPSFVSLNSAGLELVESVLLISSSVLCLAARSSRC